MKLAKWFQKSLWMVMVFSVTAVFAEDQTVEGIGVAAGSGEKASQEALNKALRNAVERAVGVMVSSESLVKNFQLIEDTIYSNVQGYVQDYEVVEDNKGAEGMTRIKVRATVRKTKLEDDLKGIRVILEAKGNPKTMVVMTETLDGEPTPLVKDRIEQFFIGKTFPMVDPSQMEAIKSRDAEELESDPSKAKVLGSRYGAQLILSGSAKAHLSGTREAYGVPVYSFSGTLSLKAINADTGDILSVLNQTGTAYSGNPDEAARDALGKAWEEGGDAFFKTIMERWRSSVLNTSDITVIVSKCAPARRVELKNQLKSVDGVKDLFEHSYRGNVCEFTMRVDGAYVKTLDETISSAVSDLILTAKTGNRLDFEVAGE